jgi:hypothetical protein
MALLMRFPISTKSVGICFSPPKIPDLFFDVACCWIIDVQQALVVVEIFKLCYFDAMSESQVVCVWSALRILLKVTVQDADESWCVACAFGCNA